jgi:TonB-dependent receptor
MATPALHAQTTGSLRGEVRSGERGAGNALIEVLGSDRSVRADARGNFVLDGLPVGNHVLRVTAADGNVREESITVSAGAQATATINVSAGDATALSVVEVTGVRAAIFSARAQERANDTVSRVITADRVGQFADQNVAESLQRLPGLTIDRDGGEGRRINVRGLGPLFNPVSLNGMRIGTSDLDRDAVVDLLPNDLLGTVTVMKTLTPNMMADAIGGAVDLRAIDPFERDPGGQVRLEASRQDYAGSTDPRFNAVYTDRIEGDAFGRFGYSVAMSYSDRSLEGDVIRNRGTPRYSRVGGECTLASEPGCFLRSERIENRLDFSERERIGASVNLEWQPNDGQSLYLRLIDSRFEQSNQTFNDRWQVATNSAVTIGPQVGSFRNSELRKQVGVLERDERSWMGQLGGSTRLDSWTFDYFAGISRNTLDIPENLNGRFRVRGITIDVAQTPNVSYVSGRPGTAATSNPANPANFAFDQLTLIEEFRDDDIQMAVFDATRYMEWGERYGSIKFGANLSRRDKEVDRQETVGNPAATGGVGNVTLANLTLRNFDTRIPNWGFHPDGREALDLFRRARGVLLPSVVNSAAEDFSVEEDVNSIYLMGTIDWTETVRLIGGVRYEDTKWLTSGKELETFDPLVGNDVLSVRDLPTVENTYGNLLPSMHLRWEPDDTQVVRASVSSAIIRPNFDEGSATRQVTTAEILGAPGTFRRTVAGGNPLLDPLRALQFDLSWAWYPDESTFVYAGVFGKRIKDFFVDGEFLGADVARLGLPVGNGTRNGGFDVARVILNGDTATVRGVELAFERAFVELPGVWSGLFVAGNYTWLDSESEVPLLRPNETLPLIDQADRLANLSLGWENEQFTFRVSGNYRGEQLDILSSNPVLDEILAPWFAYDVNLRWNITPEWQLYFDAANLDARKDATRYRGDVNGTFASDEAVNDFGPSYGLGLRFTF